MDRRIELHELLKSLSDDPHVYYQSPESKKLSYPAIIYSISDIWKRNADNRVYMQQTAYTVTVIDKDPDSELRQKVSELPMCSFDRPYVADGLNHYVFTLYY